MSTDTKTRHFLIQFDRRADLVLPWPVRITAVGEVTHGRPDAHHLLGFQQHKHVQQLDLSLTDAIAGTDPTGMYPVYSATDGSGIFAVLEKVAHFEAVAA